MSTSVPSSDVTEVKNVIIDTNVDINVDEPRKDDDDDKEDDKSTKSNLNPDPDLDIGCFRRRSVVNNSIFSQSSHLSSQRTSTRTSTRTSPDVSPSPPSGLQQNVELHKSSIADSPLASPLANTFSVRKTPTRPTNYDMDDAGAPAIELTKTDGADEAKVKSPSVEATTHLRNADKWTVVAFLNSGSGGGMGRQIMSDMVSLLGSDFVFDLKKCGAGNMPEDNLLPLAKDPFVRVLACGGDGTMGWILSSIDAVWRQVLGPDVPLEESAYKGHLPLAMMPLGTGNDLSRSFNWGPTFSNNMRKKAMITRVVQASRHPLDRWRCVVVPFEGLSKDARQWVPAMLGEKMRKNRAESIRNLRTVFGEEEGEGEDGASAKAAEVDDASIRSSVISGVDDAKASTQSFDGVFCNYFSIGVDAKVAFSFHKEREEFPQRFTSPLKNKLKYVQKGLTVGGMCSVRSSQLPAKLNGKVRVLVEAEDSDELVELKMPGHCRGIALLNIQSYGGGNRFTNSGSCCDGLIEVVFFTHPAGMAVCAGLGPLLPFLRFKVRAQTSRVCIRIDEPFHCQVDGEPWLQSPGIFQISYFGRSPVLKWNKSCCNGNPGS
mmetsp:Transcript_28684/g.57379  ORF Transcript_28684/g.57379 Transcript_28684/m.57379 type:complete len:602 (+) Transcript_28684:267-2072(+)